MILGNPYKFAFLIERIPEWEKGSWKNGIMFVMINNEIYPKDVRTTTFNCEIPDIIGTDSAFVNPIIDTKLYEKDDSEMINFVNDEENDNYYRYFIPFHEINDSGYRIYVISNRYNVKMIVCKLEDEKIKLVDKLELSVIDYNDIKMQLIKFYNETNF